MSRLARCAISILLGFNVVIFVAPLRAQTYENLHSFQRTDGKWPSVGVILDPEGNIFGLASWGGTYGFGSIYKLSAPSNGFSTINFFQGKDGAGAIGRLARSSSGDLFGTTLRGGEGTLGTVFEVKAGSSSIVSHNLAPTLGYPESGVVLDTSGNLYGTATLDGAYNEGGVFEISARGKYSLLHSFDPGSDGYGALSLVRDSAGTLYGANTYGGPYGAGSVFSLDTSGNFRVIHAFTNGSDGGIPDSGLMIDAQGNLYGTTGGGGGSAGLIFKLDSSGEETVLYAFDGVVGNGPLGPLVADEQGNLYGTTEGGGSYNFGTVFKLDTAGNLTVLHNFTDDGTDGFTPSGGLARDKSGNLYGTATYGGTGICSGPYRGCGTVFKITP
jgi:uncharacterized repeat protein (TIGR03803 family)